MQYILFLGGGLFLVWWQLKSMTLAERKEFEDALQNANYWIVIPIAMMAILSHVSRSMRWKLLMEPLNYRPRLSNVFAVTMVGYLANAAVPRLGEILKCTFLARYEKLKVDKLVGTIIVERSFDFICYLLFIAITILIQADLVGKYFSEKLSGIGKSSGVPIWVKLVLLVVGLFAIIKAIQYLFRKYPGNTLIQKINNIIKGIGEGFQSIQKLKNRRAFILHTVFIWAMYLLQIYLGFTAMSEVSHLGMKAAFSVLSLATLSMIVTPGGIGSFPIFVMQTLFIYGIDPALGKAFGWLMWGVSTGIIVITGLISLLALPYLNRHKNEKRINHTTKNLSSA